MEAITQELSAMTVSDPVYRNSENPYIPIPDMPADKSFPR